MSQRKRPDAHKDNVIANVVFDVVNVAGARMFFFPWSFFFRVFLSWPSGFSVGDVDDKRSNEL